MTKCERHPKHEAGHTCRLCKDECCDECYNTTSGICRGCLVKIGVIVLLVMIVISYSAWFGVF